MLVDFAALLLRFGLGVMFLAHGLQLAWGKLGGPGSAGFSKMLAGLGFSGPLFWAYVAGYTTLIGGACLLLGLYTRIAALLLIIFITVAAVKVHLSKGFFIMNGGYEYNFIIFIALLALIFLGAGKFAITKDL